MKRLLVGPTTKQLTTASMLFNLHLKNSQTSFEVEQYILNANAQQFNVLTCTTAIRMLGVRQSKNQHAIQTVLEISQQLKFDTRGLATCCYGIAVGKLLPKIPDFILDRLNAVDLHEFNALDISNTFWSFAKLSQQLPSKLTGKALLKAKHWSEFTPQSMANLFWSLAVLEDSFPAIESGAKYLETLATFDTFTTQAISNILWSLAKSGTAQTPLLVDKLTCELRTRPQEQLCAQDISNTIWALSSMQRTDPMLLQKFKLYMMKDHTYLAKFKPQELAQMAWGLANSEQRDFDLVQLVERELMLRRVEDFFPQHASTMLWSFATMDHACLPLCEKFARFGWRIRGVWLPQDFSNLIWAFARNSQPIPLWLITRLGEHMQQPNHLAQFTDQALANILWAFAKMPCKHLLGDFAQEVARRRATMPTSVWLTCLGAFSTLGYVPPITVTEREFVWSELSMKEMSMLVASSANLNVRNDYVLQGVAEEVCKRGFHQEAFDPCLLMWAFACLDAFDLPAVTQLFSLEHDGQVERTTNSAHQMMQTGLAWRHSRVGDAPSKLIESVCKGDWIEPMVRTRLLERIPSLAQLRIYNLLAKHFDNVVVIHETSVLGLSVDMLLEAPMNVVIEVDGPMHFLADGVSLNGGSSMKRRTLQRAGYRVYSIPVVEFQRLNETEQVAYVRELSQRILRNKIDQALCK